MPIVRHRDPNRCYDLCPLLFWTIICIAARRYARGDAALPFLLDAVKREVSAAVAVFPLGLHHINALILVCTWCFPDIRFVTDRTTLFSGRTHCPQDLSERTISGLRTMPTSILSHLLVGWRVIWPAQRRRRLPV